ncbi:MAG: hypothetical protein K8S99_02150 [Planctomycetes bacterium]|nr:hypothetical protein [Planctomycetota bacterium]
MKNAGRRNARRRKQGARPASPARRVNRDGVTWFEPCEPRLHMTSVPTPIGSPTQVNISTLDSGTHMAMAAIPGGGHILAYTNSGGTILVRRYDAQGTAIGVETQVNPNLPSPGTTPSIAADDAGDFVVAWTGADSGQGRDVFAQRFNANGTVNGSAFVVNTTTAGDQFSPSVAMDSAGDFVVAWNEAGSGTLPVTQVTPKRTTQYFDEYLNRVVTSVEQDRSSYTYQASTQSDRVMARRFSAAGSGGSELRVDASSSDSKKVLDADSPAVAMDPTGDFVIAWVGHAKAVVSANIPAQTYIHYGYSYGGAYDYTPRKIKLQDVTEAFTQQVIGTATETVMARRFAADVTPGPLTTVDSRDAKPLIPSRGDAQVENLVRTESADVAMDLTGNFVVGWHVSNYKYTAPSSSNSYFYSIDATGDQLFYRRFNTASAAQGAAAGVLPASYPSSIFSDMHVASDRGGNFTVSWIAKDLSYGDNYDLAVDMQARRFNAAGKAIESAFNVATFNVGNSADAAVDILSTGNLLFAWTPANPISSANTDVFFQQFEPPKPDLTGRITSVTLKGVNVDSDTPLIPGDVIDVVITVDNLGNQAVTDPLPIRFYTSADQTYSPDTDTFLADAAIAKPALTESDGATPSKQYTIKLTIPTDAATGSFFLVAKIDPDDLLVEKDETNNTMASGSAALVTLSFGDFGTRTGVPITFTTSDGTVVTCKLSGGGGATLTALGGFYDVVLFGSTAKSVITITTKKGENHLIIRNITIGEAGGPAPEPLKLKSLAAAPGGGDAAPDSSALGKLVAKTARLIGSLSAPNGIGAITLEQVDSGAAIDIGAGADPTTPVTLAFNLVEDAKITSAHPIKSLTVTKWSRSDSADSFVHAPSIGTLSAKGDKKFAVPGDFEADLTLDDGGAKTLNSAKIAGSLSDAAWLITGAVGSVAVTGDVDDFTLNSSTLIKSFKAASIKNAAIVAGTDAGSITAFDWLAGSLTAQTAKALSFKGNAGAASAGNFAAAVTLTGNVLAKSTLPSAKIAGSILGGTWTLSGPVASIATLATDPSWILQSGGTGLDLAKLAVTQDLGGTIDINSLGKATVGGNILDGTDITLRRTFDALTPKVLALSGLAVKGAINGLTLRAVGGIGAVSAASITGSDIYAGLALGFTGLPDQLSDLATPTAPLASLTTAAFADTRVASGVIGTLALGTIDTTNGSAVLGVAGDSIAKFTGIGSAGAITLPLDGEAVIDGDFILRLLV